MKKFLFLFVLTILLINSSELFSIGKVVVQNGDNVTFYEPNMVWKAFQDAAEGSSIYLPGNDMLTQSGGGELIIYVQKKLNIYGTGHYTSATGATGISKVNFLFLKTSSGSKIEGVYINKLYIASSDTVKNLTFKKCYIQNMGPGVQNDVKTRGEDISFYDCVIISTGIYSSFVPQQFKNWLFKRCFIQYQYGNYSNSTFINCINTSNIIIGTSNIFENCILWSNSSYNVNNFGTNNLFENCLTAWNVQNFGGNNITINCLFNQAQSTIFENYSSGDFKETYDFHLKSNCAGKNFGTDGTDLGIYGTDNPYKPQAIPIIPYIKAMTIPTKTVNGILEISVDVESQTK